MKVVGGEEEQHKKNALTVFVYCYCILVIRNVSDHLLPLIRNISLLGALQSLFSLSPTSCPLYQSPV